MKTPVTIAPEALDFTQLIRAGETIGWAEATAEPVFLTRLLDAQAERCPPFRVFFALTFSDGFAANHPNVTVTALGGASAGRRFFANRADNVMPANISDISGLVSSGRLPIDVVLVQVSGPDETGRYNAGLGIEHLHAAIGRAIGHRASQPRIAVDPWRHGDRADGNRRAGAGRRTSLNEQWSELAFTSEDAVLPFSRIAERMLLFLRTGTGMGLHPASGATVPL